MSHMGRIPPETHKIRPKSIENNARTIILAAIRLGDS